MKIKHFVCVLLVSLMMFTSCGEANVAGKHFENETYPLSVDFAPKGNNVFYLTAVCPYTVKGSDIDIQYNGQNIRLQLKENTLYIYERDEEGNPTQTLAEKGLTFVEKGTTDFFSNVLAGTEQAIRGMTISFADSTASVSDYSVGYTFDEDTGLYTVDGCEGTFYKDDVIYNAYDKLVHQALPDSVPPLDYESAFWARQSLYSSIQDELVDIYLKAYYPEEYEQAKSDDFAYHKLTEQVKDEIQSKIDGVSAEQAYTLEAVAKLEKYDFKTGTFSIKTDFTFPYLYSTLEGCDYPMEVRLGRLDRRSFFSSVTWYSNYDSKVTMALPEDKASELNSNGVTDCILVYTIVPIFWADTNQLRSEMNYSDWGLPSRAQYILYYEIKSAELYSTKDLTKIGDVTVTSRF
ncbi:MAG: DUF4852 domain-containing protein [Treponema sp.]|nr:DUF4852 domain-containing protein [Candidatus Treponema caballi]